MKMKSYLSLIPISAKTRRKQNRLVLLCIIFAVALVTTVFSFAEILSKGEEESLVKKHGSHHIVISGIAEEKAAQIASQENVSASAWYREFGEDIYEGYQIDDKRVILYGTERAYVDDIRKYEVEGTFPENGQEVMLNADAKERLGTRTGDRITIRTPAGGIDYTVTGFCKDEWVLDSRSKYDGVCAYMSVDALERLCMVNGQEGEPSFYVRFAQGENLKNAVADLKAQYGLSDGDIEENMITMGASGASSNEGINNLYLTAMIVFFMVLTAGVLMISSCMNSTVSQRTKFFGMMRCIGASKKQVMRFVRLEALNWCKSAVPIGLGLSFAVTWILYMILKYKMDTEFSEFSFRFSVAGIVSGILVGVVTVLIAAHSPAKRAAGVSPVAAVSGNAEMGKKATYAASTRILKVESALGVYHATAVKKNLILMSLSFAFTVTLFLAFYAGLDLVRRLIPSESDLSPDISIASPDNANSIDRGMKEEIGNVPGVEVCFGCAMSLDVPAEINDVSGSVDLVSYDDYMFAWSKNSVVSGDMDKVTGDTDYVLTIFNMDSRLDTGDRITIGDTQLEIACVASEGVGTENRPAIVCTEETFKRLTGEESYILLGAQLEKDAAEDTVETVRKIAGENEFIDRREEQQANNSSFWMVWIGVYGFLSIIILITVFNIMNNISMSVSARIKQYGAMRAVGMSVDQVTKMIAAEAVTYSVCGLAAGYAAGLYLHRLIMVKVVFTHFGGHWTIPFEPVIIITVIVAVSCAAAVYTPAKQIRDMEITETINEL